LPSDTGVYKTSTTIPSADGLYYFLKPLTWKEKDKVAFDAGKTTIRANITLQPVTWDPSPVKVTGVGSSIADAVSKAQQGTPYIYKFTSNQNANDLKLSSTNAGLYIIGVGAGSTITLNGDGNLFTVGGDKTNTLILQNAILKGKTGGKAAAVFVRDGASFFMETGSGIDGFEANGSTYNNDNDNGGFGAAAIHIDGANFTMNGGTISNNKNKYNHDRAKLSAGAIYVEMGASDVKLNGGSFSNNANDKGGTTDIYFTYTPKIKIGGAVSIGEICIGKSTATPPVLGQITVDPTFSGSAKINLSGEKANWNGKEIFKGGITSGQTSLFTAGKYMTSGTAYTATFGTDGKVTITN